MTYTQNLNFKNITELYRYLNKTNVKNCCFQLYRNSRFQQFKNSIQKFWLFLLKFLPTAKFIYYYKFRHALAMHNYQVGQFIDDVINNQKEYENLYKLLTDDESKQTLINILLYKLTFDNTFHKGYYRPIQDQYLDLEILSFTKDDVIADCGAFIGDNAITYFKYMKTAKSYYLIEPDLKICNMLNGYWQKKTLLILITYYKLLVLKIKIFPLHLSMKEVI